MGSWLSHPCPYSETIYPILVPNLGGMRFQLPSPIWGELGQTWVTYYYQYIPSSRKNKRKSNNLSDSKPVSTNLFPHNPPHSSQKQEKKKKKKWRVKKVIFFFIPNNHHGFYYEKRKKEKEEKSKKEEWQGTLKWNAPATNDLKVGTCQMLTSMDRILKGKEDLLYNWLTFREKWYENCILLIWGRDVFIHDVIMERCRFFSKISLILL